MKTFINAARLAVISLLFVSLTVLGDCCPTKCAPKRCATTAGCKLQPEPVKIRKTCDHPGYYKQVCHLEYVPCEGKVEEITAYPKFIGCYDETGARLDGNGAGVGYTNAAQVITPDVQVSVPVSYEQTRVRKAVRNHKKFNNNKRINNNNNNNFNNDADFIAAE